MTTITEEIVSSSQELYNQASKKYRVLSNFKGTYIEKQMINEESIVDPIFRVFIPYKPERQRNINISLENNFDPYVDSLMDYPTIIGNKLNKHWKLFNRLISIQVPTCINDCWHCYLPSDLISNSNLKERTTELTAREIIDKFYKQKEMDALSGKLTNVLRITGGEPFLLPSLILECLNIIKEDKENKYKGVEEFENIFIWTETNLTPFISLNGVTAFMDRPENIELLKQISQHSNFLVHPCFHGLDAMEYQQITDTKRNVSLEVLINALSKFNRNEDNITINIYPTFGSNVCNPKNVRDLFNKLHSIDNQLPLRTALVEYKTDYEPVIQRLKKYRNIDLYSKFANIRIWNKLLKETYGLGYGTLPRHLQLSNNSSSLYTKEVKVYSDSLYLFKGSFRDLYHREALDILSLPLNHSYEVEYEEKWIQEDFFNFIKHKPNYFTGKFGIFIYVDKKNGNIFPLRRFKLVKSSTVGNILKLNIKLLDFISINIDNKYLNVNSEMQNVLSKYFGSKTIPPSPIGKYLLYGESFFDANVFNFTDLTDNNIEIKIDSTFETFRKNIDDLIKCEFMRDSIFFHINPINMTISTDTDSLTYYEVKSGDNFTINLENYLPNYSFFESLSSSERDINISISKDSIQLMGNAEYNCPKYSTKSFVFKTNEVRQEELVIINFYSKNREFKSPNIEIRIKLIPRSLKEAINSSLISIFLLLWMGFAAIVAGYNSSSGTFAPFKVIKNNLYSNNVLNYSYIISICCLVLAYIGLTYWTVRFNIFENMLFKRTKL